MRSALAPRVVVPCVLLALGWVPAPAFAQPVDPQKLAAAQTLFEQAQAAMDKKDYATACPKLEEVTHLLPNGVGGLITLARCYEGARRLASAWSTFLAAQGAAAQAKRPVEEKQARERAALLKPRLAQLTIVVPEALRGLPGISIARDDTPVGTAQWGAPLPVDRGKHVVVVTATGKLRWEKTVDVPADGARVSLDVDALADAPPENPADKPGSAAPSFWDAQHVAGAAVGGVGLVGVVIGSAFGAVAISKKSQSNDGHCMGTTCDPTGAQLRSEGLSAARISTGVFIAGAVVLAAGVTLLAVPSKRPGTVTARVGVGLGAVRVSGTW